MKTNTTPSVVSTSTPAVIIRGCISRLPRTESFSKKFSVFPDVVAPSGVVRGKGVNGINKIM